MNFLNRRRAVVMAILTAGAVGTAQAEQDFQAVESKLRTVAPTAETIAISETPIAGLLQAQINNEILYVSDDGTYLMQGTLYEIETRTNLTEQAKSVFRKEIMEGLDYSKAISFAPENPEFELVVFTDIDCGYCRKLHGQIEEYMEEGIAIRYMAYPRAGIGSHSYDKFVSVWCAADQRSALTLAKNGEEPEPLQCENPVTEQFELGRSVGVSGTPALVTLGGSLIPGYMPPAQLKQRLVDMAAADAAP